MPSAASSAPEAHAPIAARGINIEQALKSLREWARSARSFHEFAPRYPLYLRMKPQERKLLVDELWLWEKRGKGKGREAEQAFVAQVAMLLFLRWSWASDTLRTVLATLSSMLFMPSTIDSGRHIEILGRTLACRGPTGQLPFDVRQGRVKALLADSDNKSFWDMMRNRPEVLWNSVREIAVVPHSDDWNVWRSLARLAIMNYTYLALWPGLSEAAVFASEKSVAGIPVDRYQPEGLTDAADVWDIWILVRLLKRRRTLEENSEMEQETREIFERLGGTQHGIHYCIECISFYDDDITEITDVSLRNAMLTSAGLGGPVKGMEDWDLVAVYGQDSSSLYISEDVNSRWRWVVSGRQLPGLYGLCDCEHWKKIMDPKGKPSNKDTWCYRNRNCYGEWPGIVYARRKLNHAMLWRIFDRLWSNWSDCLLVRGKGLTRRTNELCDPETVYLLETLPGIKARLLRGDRPSMEGARRVNLFFNLKLQKSEYRPGKLNWFDCKTARGDSHHPALDDFILKLPRTEFDFGFSELLDNNARGTSLLVPWSRARRYDQYGDINMVKDKAVVKIVGQAWWDFQSKTTADNDEAALATRSLQKLAYLSEIGITGNRIENVVQLKGYTWIPLADIRLHNHPNPTVLSSQLYYPQNAEGIQKKIDDSNRRGQITGVCGLVFEYAHGGQLLYTVKKYFKTRNDIRDPEYNPLTETFAVDNWGVILRFMYEIGTAIQNLPAPHRALKRSNVLLRHRPFPPKVFEKVIKDRPFLDRYQAVLADPCPPEEAHSIGMWGDGDYPRPVGDPNCDRGEDAMRFGYLARRLIREAMPGLEDDRRFPESQRHHDRVPPKLLFVEIINYIDLLGQAKKTRNNAVAIQTMNEMLAFIERIVVDKELKLHLDHRVAEDGLEYSPKWCADTLDKINPNLHRIILFRIALFPEESDPEISPGNDGGSDDDDSSPKSSKPSLDSSGSADARKRGSGSDTDGAGSVSNCGCPSPSISGSSEEDSDEWSDDEDYDGSDEPDIIDVGLGNGGTTTEDEHQVSQGGQVHEDNGEGSHGEDYDDSDEADLDVGLANDGTTE